MPLSHRIERIAEQMREELSQILATEVRDPGVGLVTVSRVKVTADLSLARVYWTVLGEPSERRRRAKALNRAAPFVRHVLASRLTLRRVPEVEFQYDESVAAHQDASSGSSRSCTSRRRRGRAAPTPTARRGRRAGGAATAEPTGHAVRAAETAPEPTALAEIVAATVAASASSSRRTSGPTATPSVGAWRWRWRCARSASSATVVMDACRRLPAAVPRRRRHHRSPTAVTETVDAAVIMECSALDRTGVAGLDRSPVSTSIIIPATPSTARSTGSTSRRRPAASWCSR